MSCSIYLGVIFGVPVSDLVRGLDSCVLLGVQFSGAVIVLLYIFVMLVVSLSSPFCVPFGFPFGVPFGVPISVPFSGSCFVFRSVTHSVSNLLGRICEMGKINTNMLSTFKIY